MDMKDQISAILQTYSPAKTEKDESPKEKSEKADNQTSEQEATEQEGSTSDEQATDQQAEGDDKAAQESAEAALVKQLQAQIEALSKKISDLTGDKQKETKPEAEAEQLDLPLGFFKDKEEYEKVFEDPKLMNEVLLRVHNKAVEKTIRMLPQVIKNVVDTHMVVHSKTADFFKENEDLLPHREFVGFVANDLATKNPDWSVGKLFEELAPEVRKRLGLRNKIAVGKAGFAKKGTSAKKPPEKELPSVEKEIMELIS